MRLSRNEPRGMKLIRTAEEASYGLRTEANFTAGPVEGRNANESKLRLAACSGCKHNSLLLKVRLKAFWARRIKFKQDFLRFVRPEKDDRCSQFICLNNFRAALGSEKRDVKVMLLFRRKRQKAPSVSYRASTSIGKVPLVGAQSVLPT
jgi:hypothetical protein